MMTCLVLSERRWRTAGEREERSWGPELVWRVGESCVDLPARYFTPSDTLLLHKWNKLEDGVHLMLLTDPDLACQEYSCVKLGENIAVHFPNINPSQHSMQDVLNVNQNTPRSQACQGWRDGIPILAAGLFPLVLLCLVFMAVWTVSQIMSSESCYSFLGIFFTAWTSLATAPEACLGEGFRNISSVT